ncbi:MAG: 30S ribosome-binding factor RbfA [Mariniblastus sp.]|nr:30S ribosome-binding factor RbfA [Mariniblastus sp.]
MSSRRVLKAAQAIREVVSMSILTDMKDPRIKDVTVTFVEVSADLRNAKVHVSVMGDEKKKKLCLQGLQHASGFLQQKVGTRIDTRYTPRVQFVLDKGIENAMAVTRILKEVLPQDENNEELAEAAREDGHDMQDAMEHDPEEVNKEPN